VLRTVCRSRENVFASREARHRLDRGRKPLSSTEPVNGDSATTERGARERKASVAAKGRRLVEARRSSSRERRCHYQGIAGTVALRCGRAVRVAHDGRHLGSGKRTPFTRPPRNRSRRPTSARVEPATAGPRPRNSAEATGVSEIALKRRRGKKMPPCAQLRGRRSGRRVVNRDAPQPRSHRLAPSHSVPSSARLRTSGGRSAKKTFRVNEHEPRGSVRVRHEREGRKALEHGSQRWETAKPGCSSLNCFGVQKSVGRISPATPGKRTKRGLGYARTNSNESPAAQ
jgi:hypothetical protein